MSDEDADEQDDPEPAESGPEDRSRGFHLEAGLRPLSDLLGNLVEVTVDTGEAPPPQADSEDWPTVDESDVDQSQNEDGSRDKRTTRVQTAESDEYLIDTRFYDDEFVVTVDVPGASKDDLSVGINPKTNTLVISKDGAVLERVDLPWRSPETTSVWFNNGVLEVRLQSAEP